MNDIYRILEKLDSITESPSADSKVKQLPALFKPKSVSPALAGRYPTKNATRGYMVGEESDLGSVFEPGIENTQEYQQGYNSDRAAKNPHAEGTTAWTRWLKGRMDRLGPRASQGGFMKNLAEEMSEIEEDMLSKVKKDLTQYLDKLEKKMQVDSELTNKAVDAVEKGQVEQDQDTEQDEPLSAVESAPVKTVSMPDGRIVEIHGNVQEGFQIRHRDRSMPSRFGTLEEAEMAIELFRNRRKNLDQNQDYLDEA